MYNTTSRNSAGSAFGGKNIFILTLLLVTIFSVTACKKQTDPNNSSQKQNLTKEGFRRPDFGQPEERANISGLVKSIVGNEVTVLKIERPNREEMQNNENENTENSKNKENSEQTRTNLTRTFSGNSGMRGGMVMRGGQRPEMSDENRTAMLERIKEMSSGEEKITIPVGIRMLKMSDGEPVEATLEDVKQDSMLIIWTDQNITDRNIATFVMIN